jgi:hypothetical protein
MADQSAPALIAQMSIDCFHRAMDDLSSSIKTVLGLASGGIGVVIGLSEKQATFAHSWEAKVVVVALLFSIMTWLALSTNIVKIRLMLRDLAGPEPERAAKGLETVKAQSLRIEKGVWIQRFSFTVGVVFLVYAWFAGISY